MKTEKAMSKRAFMRETGFSFPTVQKLWADPSFPVVAEKVFWSDFVTWRRKTRQSQNPQKPPNPEPDGGHTKDGSIRRNDSPNALPPRAARLRASFV